MDLLEGVRDHRMITGSESWDREEQTFQYLKRLQKKLEEDFLQGCILIEQWRIASNRRGLNEKKGRIFFIMEVVKYWARLPR